jgi:thiol-disulfide isomerase/thioredoxin
MRVVLILAMALLTIAASSCQKRREEKVAGARLELPRIYDAAFAERYTALGDSGYALLEAGKNEEATAVFMKQIELAPQGRSGAYNLACAHGRAGDVAKGLEWLAKAIEGGWDDAAQIEEDPDLASLKGDPRFTEIVTAARENADTRGAALAGGLPRYAEPPIAFPDADSLDRWLQAENLTSRRHRTIWHGWQATAVKMDVEARRLAALGRLKAGDTAFDANLERVRAISRIKSTYEPWGPLSNGVLKEVTDYLATNPGEAGKSEANYLAAVAIFCRTLPEEADDPRWPLAADAARKRLENVPPGTDYAGAAEAARLMMDLVEARDQRAPLKPRLAEFARQFRGDRKAMDVAGRFFQKDLVEAVWPIAIDETDIEGRPVSLDDYKGKVVLVDFWATWCAPCRAELPHLRAAYEAYHARGFEVLSISLDFPERTTVEAYRNWTAENGMSWRHIYEQRGWESPLAAKFLVRSIPNPLLIGRDGSLKAMGDDCRGENLMRLVGEALAAVQAS